MSPDTSPPQPISEPVSAPKDESLPLPKWLTRIYYIFPIVLFVPDMLFNFYVYSDGLLNVQFPDVLWNIQFYLWAFLAAGIVGMAWLLSVLAPWHWSRGHRFQSIMCWCGVVIATAITTWSSLAYRSLSFKAFATDKWVTDTFHIRLGNFSPTMVLVSIAPPFWGLFWAIVQPAEKRRSMSEERETHLMKLERVKQEAEVKRLRAEANAQIREAQLKGLASSMRAARAQIGAAMQGKDAPVEPQVTIVESTATPQEPPQLPAPAEVPEPVEEEVPPVVVATGRPGSSLLRQHAGQDLRPGTRAFTDAVRRHIGAIESQGRRATVAEVASRMNDTEANVASAYNDVMLARKRKR